MRSLPGHITAATNVLPAHSTVRVQAGVLYWQVPLKQEGFAPGRAVNSKIRKLLCANHFSFTSWIVWVC
jgi:hypothetical protein